MLGECQSKCEHLAKVPLRPNTARELNQVYLAKGIQATTAIEGNTLSEEQVLQHLRGELTLPPSQEYLKQEVDNILRASDEIAQMVKTGAKMYLSPERFMELNAQVLQNLDVDEDVVPGTIRTHSVVVGNVYRGAPAEDCGYLLDELCKWINGPQFTPAGSLADYKFIFAILRAVLAHLYLAWIHPFGDGNGRTARLVEVEILMSSGLPRPATNLLSSHYNKTRTEYYRQLDRASKSNGEVVPFIEYAVQGFLDGLREYIALVWEQHYDVTWRSYVQEYFRDAVRAEVRRRELVLDLSRQEKSVTKAQIAELTPRLIKHYSRNTDRRLLRDLNDLVERGLIVKEGNAYRAHKEIILSFLPLRAADSGKD
jgi:Fic family protein